MIKRYFRQFTQVYTNEFRLVRRDAGLLLFFIFLPFIYPVLYSLIYNPEVVREVPMVIIDNDRTARSRELVRNIDATQQERVIGYASDLTEGKRAMAGGDAVGILEIPAGFERKIGRNEQANAVIYSDMTLLLRYKAFLEASTNVAQEMGAEILSERIEELAPIAETLAPGDPMPMHNVAMGNIMSGFDSFIMPGIVILILQQVLVLAIGMAGGAKHEKPELIGYDPVNSTNSVFITMLGQMACYTMVLAIPILFLVHFVPLIFAFPMAGDNFQILAFLLPMVIASCGLGFMFQGIVTERESVFILWVVTSVIFLFLSGLTWPRYAMAPIWKLLGDLAPATFGVEGFIRMNTNGATITQVLPDYIALWIQSAVYMTLGYCVQKWVVRPAERKSLLDRRAYREAVARMKNDQLPY